ncbi:MAG TPA: DUF4384 domain-containing protein [Drouetiella sp.]
MIGRRHIISSMVALLTLGAPLCAIAEDGEKGDADKWQYAKGLFRTQLEKPTENLNIGLHYWIEIQRNGHSQRVSNKYAFKKGDKIQIHMKPNIDGYAYVVLRSTGATQENQVLFPDTTRGDNNKVARGVDYALPSSGESFEFDANAGTEKLSLLLSRNPIDAQAYLSKPADTPVTIASAFTGSKDLVPSQVFVAYANPHDLAPPPVKEAPKKVTKVATKPVTNAVSDESSESKAPTKKPHKTTTVKTASTTTSTTTTTSKHENTKASFNDEAGVTTVVKKSPDGVLFVNVDLDHRS